MNVTIIKQDGLAAIVEYVENSMPKRAIVPASEVINNSVPDDVLEAAIPYGVEWAELVQIDVTPDAICRHLRNRGIWTFEDAQSHLRDVTLALQAAYQISASKILKLGGK